jgi:hypothetical protein
MCPAPLDVQERKARTPSQAISEPNKVVFCCILWSAPEFWSAYAGLKYMQECPPLLQQVTENTTLKLLLMILCLNVPLALKQISRPTRWVYEKTPVGNYVRAIQHVLELK